MFTRVGPPFMHPCNVERRLISTHANRVPIYHVNIELGTSSEGGACKVPLPTGADGAYYAQPPGIRPGSF